jgi:hypothetical protein
MLLISEKQLIILIKGDAYMAVKKEIDVAVIEDIKLHLETAAHKETATRTIMDALHELKPSIETALCRGYSRDDVIKMLAEKGLEVKAYQLKALFKKVRE